MIVSERCRIPGASGARRQWRSCLHLHPSMVGWHHGHSPLADGTFGEAGSARAPAARPPGALWRLSSAAQPPARGDHPDAAPARGGQGGDGHGIALLALGTAAEARLCTGHGALPLVSRGDAADYCRHHAGRGDPHDPPASEARRGPPCHGSGACPPRSLCVVLGLTAPRASPPRLRPLPWGGTTPPSPAPPAVSPHTVRGRRGMAVRRQRLPSAPRGCPWATSFALAASCTLVRV